MISRAGPRLFELSILLFIVFDLAAQPFNRNHNFKHLNVQNGLVQNIAYHFLQDNHGFMWIGTHNGLTMYDGVRTINFLHNDQDARSIAGNFITGIFEDSAHRVWIGNENGIDVHVRSTNSFIHYGVDRPDGKKDNTYCAILGFISMKELWFLDTKTRSIRSLNTETGTTSFIAELNASAAVMYKGAGQKVHVWSCYDRGSIYQVYINNKLLKEQMYFSGKQDAMRLPELQVIHILQQNDTTAWLSTNAGLVKLNPEKNTYTLFNRWQNEEAKEFRYAAFSPTGNLWVGSGPAGVYEFDVNNNEFMANYRSDKLDPFSICSDNIVSLYFDHTGHIWFGSYGNGVSYTSVENSFFSNHLSKNEMQAWNAHNNISWMDVDRNGNLWCMLQNIQGFWIVDKDLRIKLFKNPRVENGAYFNNGFSKLLFDDNNNVWCATNIGLYRYDLAGNTMHFIKYDLISRELQGSIWLRDLIKLNDGSLLFSTFSGIYHLENKSGNYIVKPINFQRPEDYNGFGPLFQDRQNNIYIRSLSSYFYILKPNREGKDYTLIKTISFKPLVNQFFNEDGDSNIYMATSEGLYQINNQNFDLKREDVSDDLPFRNVSSVYKKGNAFWIFGEKGLYFFDKKTNTSRLYNTEDGLPAEDFTRAALNCTADGRCIAGTSNGLVSFFPGKQQPSFYPPRPQFSNIYINDIADTSAANPNEVEELTLSHKQNTFAFDFSAITFEHAADCSFEYKLEKYDDEWIRAGPAKYTRYSKIPPGNYSFNVRAIDAAGKISPFTKTLEISVGRAFWQTTFFKVAMLVLVLAAAWLLARWYLNFKTAKQRMEFAKLQAIEKERTRIATDMHDDLGAGLSRIKFLSESIRSKKGADGLIQKDIEKISAFSDEMAEKMGEIVWALNEKNDTVADLVAFTRSYANEYLSGQNIHCTSDTPLNLPGTFITGEMRQNIFLSVKECLHNIVKHAQASEVYFSIRLNGGIEIIIHDNGKGIDWDSVRPFSNGLQNIERRMAAIKGTAVFNTVHGTKVVLTIPMSL